MKRTVEHVMSGLINYANAEVMDKLPTSGQWVMGTVIGMATNKAGHVIMTLKENPLVSMLGVIDEDNNVDIDELMDALHNAAEKSGNLVIDVPFVGTMTFNYMDVDNLKKYVM